MEVKKMRGHVQKQCHYFPSYNNKPRPQFIYSFLTICTIILCIFGCGCIEDNHGPPKDNMHFSVSGNAYGPTIVFLPMPLSKVLIDNLTLNEGKAEFGLINTTHGQMLKVSFEGKFDIEATWFPLTQSEKMNMTIDLTTMDFNGTPLKPLDFLSLITYPNRLIWINWSNGPLNGISIFSRMIYHSSIFEYSDRYISSGLVLGWNNATLKAHHSGYAAP